MSPVTALDKNHEMTREEIVQRIEAIEELPYLIIPQDVFGDPELEVIVQEYNELRMNNKPEDLERMRFLVNKFTYEKQFARERKMEENLTVEDISVRALASEEMKKAIDQLPQDAALAQYYETDISKVHDMVDAEQEMADIDHFIKELGLEVYFREEEEQEDVKRR